MGPSFFIFGMVFLGIFGSSEVFIFTFFGFLFFFDSSISRFWHFGAGSLHSRHSSSSVFFSFLTLLCPGFGTSEEGVLTLVIRLLWFSFRHRLFFVPFRFLRFKGRSSPRFVLVVVLDIFKLILSRQQGGDKLPHRSFVGRTEWHENSIRGIVVVVCSCGLNGPLDSRGDKLPHRSFVGRTEWHENSTSIRGIVVVVCSCSL